MSLAWLGVARFLNELARLVNVTGKPSSARLGSVQLVSWLEQLSRASMGQRAELSQILHNVEAVAKCQLEELQN